MRRPVLLLRLLVALPLVGACGSAGSDLPGSAGDGRSARFSGVHAAVCAAAAASAGGDRAGAAERFDDAHASLHELAEAAGEEDRAVAARLLEAKQRVEAGGDARAMEVLAGAVTEAVVAIGGDTPGPCPGPSGAGGPGSG